MNNVEHPKHYTSHPSGIECIDITEHHDFCIGNAIKYLWRAGLKADEGKTDAQKEIEDLQKAVWYINRKIECIKRGKVSPTGCDLRENQDSVGIILGGKLLWIDTCNLRDPENAIGIAENGEYYFDFDAAQVAARTVGKRLMTSEEYRLLRECENWWDKKRKGRVFRVPSQEEGYVDLFFPASGHRNNSNGAMSNVGQVGYYWSASPNGTYGYNLYFNTGAPYLSNNNRSYGFSVRCVVEL